MATINAKEWLGNESRRNKRNADLFTDIVKAAYGCDEAVLIGHHIGFQRGSDISTEDEIPSADSLIFDHPIMTAVFGDKAPDVLAELATLPVPKRDHRLAELFYGRE